MKHLRPALALALLALGSASSLRAEEPSKVDQAKATIKESAHEVAEATKRAAVATKDASEEIYDKTAKGARHAAEVTKEKSKEAFETAKEATKEAAAKAKETSIEVGKTIAEKTEEAAAAAKEKALELTTTKDELARYDRNHDGKLDAAERARMDADKAGPKK